MRNFRITITGTTPLLMHNGRLSDPIDPATKKLAAITRIAKKTEADHLDAARAEWLGGLYWDSEAGPYMPGENLARCVRDAAVITKHGKAIDRGVIITTSINPIAYPGPREVEKLWEDENYRLRKSVKNQMNRVMRTRPMFRNWTLDCEGILDENMLSFETLVQIVANAGQFVGLGDWRPGSPHGGSYGRFTASVEDLGAAA